MGYDLGFLHSWLQFLESVFGLNLVAVSKKRFWHLIAARDYERSYKESLPKIAEFFRGNHCMGQRRWATLKPSMVHIVKNYSGGREGVTQWWIACLCSVPNSKKNRKAVSSFHPAWLTLGQKTLFPFWDRISCNPLASNLLCSQGWLWISSPPASTSRVLES